MGKNRVQKCYINCLKFQQFNSLQATLYWRPLVFAYFPPQVNQPFALHVAMPTFIPNFIKWGDQMVVLLVWETIYKQGNHYLMALPHSLLISIILMTLRILILSVISFLALFCSLYFLLSEKKLRIFSNQIALGSYLFFYLAVCTQMLAKWSIYGDVSSSHKPATPRTMVLGSVPLHGAQHQPNTLRISI